MQLIPAAKVCHIQDDHFLRCPCLKICHHEKYKIGFLDSLAIKFSSLLSKSNTFVSNIVSTLLAILGSEN